MGLEGLEKPSFANMSGKVTDYINQEFLPADLPEDFQLNKVFRLPPLVLLSWVEHILKRQELWKLGEIETIFAWKCWWSSIEKRWVDVDEPEEVQSRARSRKRKHKKASSEPKIKRGRTSGASEKEIEDDLEDTPVPSDVPSDFDKADLEPGSDDEGSDRWLKVTGKGKETVEPRSPAAHNESWESMVTFLSSLSPMKHYQKLVQYLQRSTVSSCDQQHCFL